MNNLYTTLVNETVVQAVQVALDNYAAEHSARLELGALSGVITQAEEEVIRKGILTGLQNLCHVKSAITMWNKHAVNNGAVVADDAQVMNKERADEAVALQMAMSRLLHNATALQDVIEKVTTRIHEHLGSSRQPHRHDEEAVVSVYGAAPEVTLVLEAAVEEQMAWRESDIQAESVAATPMNMSIVSHLSTFSAAQWLWLVATLVIGFLVVRFVFGRVLSLGGALNRRRRTRTVLIGLSNSGKTALFGQLVRRIQLRETRTSMRENIGPLFAAKERGIAETAPGVSVVDCPGHPRLRERMLHAVGEAVNVVVVIDSVTVQDNPNEGVAALAELLLSVLQSPEFYGVQKLLFACTKRDEITSYASKAVRKLLEAAMVTSIESRQNAMGRVESVRDSNNAVITSKSRNSCRGGAGGRRYVLSVENGDSAGADHDVVRSRLCGSLAGHVDGEESGVKRFSFAQLGIPFAFVDVSSRPYPIEHKYSVTPVEDFILMK